MSKFKPIDIHGARLSRRGFIAAGGALVVAVSIASPRLALAAATGNSLDAANPASWIEIHADNTLVIRTGKCDFGQSSIFTAYPQIVAEELGFPFEAVKSVISGDTDRTPDGGGTFGLLRTNVLNLRKAAAYTREAVLELAATRFGVPKAQLSIADGVITGGGNSATFGELVAGQDLQLEIPVTGELTSVRGLVVAGDPPLKPWSEYKVVGQPVKNSSLRPKMSGEATWVGDVKLPNMLHARVIHPATLGSTLVAPGTLDSAAYPNTQLVQIGNLLAVVAPSEWEAIRASRVVSRSTQWSQWAGLPGSDGLEEHFRSGVDWNEIPVNDGRANTGDIATATPARTHSASYLMPYFKHAPISPSVTLADVQPDGSITVHTHSQNPQSLRRLLAESLETGEDKVVVRTYPGSGHYGLSNGGSVGSEHEAALLSKELGRPVRVQWMRDDDMKWTTNSHAALADIEIGLDDAGMMVSYSAAHHAPPMQDDRPLGALLAGKPTMHPPIPDGRVGFQRANVNMVDEWLYGTTPNVLEKSYSTYQIGERESPLTVGLRDHSMRTPIQFQQNFPRELAISEAAALAGKDALQFRLEHVTEPRFQAILNRLRDETGWEVRPSPAPGASANGDAEVRGRGVSLMLRDNGYWACAAEVAVTPSSGVVRVEKVTLVVDPGIVVNPLQLERQAQAGCLMGVSQALNEEVTFDQGAITSVDWNSYPILTMNQMPEVRIILHPTPESGVYGQGSESANALAGPAIAAAFFDATGKPIRRLPLTPAHVQRALSA